MRYVKKPIPVEAFCPAEEAWPEWFMNNHIRVILKEDMIIEIDTLGGTIQCSGNDYIIQGIDGELYPCRRDIFLKTYEKFEEDN